MTVSFYVPGKPAPQGSKRHVGGGRMIESSKAVKPWRLVIAGTARRLGHTTPIVGAVQVMLEFVMPRPKSLPSTKPTPPAIKRNGDLDKLVRAVLDSLTGIAWEDDCLVTDIRARKRTAELGEDPGVRITYCEASPMSIEETGMIRLRLVA